MTGTGLNEKKMFYGWLNVLYLFLIYAASLGFVFYGFTVIFPAMIKAQGWGRGEAALGQTIRGLLVGFMAPLVAYSIGRIGAKKTIGIGIAIGSIALFTLGTVANQLWHWILLWGFVMPFTFSFGGAIPITATVTFWFNVRRATALGIVVTGAAVAGFIAAPLFTHLMKITGNWRTGWLACGFIAIIALALSFLLKNKPGDIGQYPDGINPESSTAGPSGGKIKKPKTYRTPQSWTLKEAIKTPTVYLFMACMIAQAWTTYILTVHGVLHFTDKGFTQMQAASVISCLVLLSGFARFPMGIIGDIIEPRILIAISMLCMAITMLFLWRTPDNMIVVLVIAGIYGFCFGATVTLFPTLLGNYFGPSAFAPINGFMVPFVIPIAAPVPFLAGLIYDRFHSYDWAFIPIIIMVFIATACSFMMKPPKKKNNVS